MPIEQINDRSALRFPEEVIKRFSYLQAAGFHCVRSDTTLVQFESSTIRINVYHGRQSFEIGLEIQSLLPPTNSYSFYEIFRLIDPVQSDLYKKYAARTTTGVVEGVDQLANLFYQCVLNNVLNNPQLFSHLEIQKRELTMKFGLEVELLQARRKSEIAWRQKDYTAFVKTLKPLYSELTATEIKKLEFAEKQCAM